MKILLINLPLPEPYYPYQKWNHQLFSDYIKAIINKKRISGIEIVDLGKEIIDTCNDHNLADEIIKLKPDIVGFTSYLWNVERNIKIAGLLKSVNIITITGGPEVQRDNHYLLQQPVFDHFFIGEGEISFIEFLDRIQKSSPVEKVIQNVSSVDINDFIVEYAESTTGYKVDKRFYFEIERGCPYQCNYCAYGKSRTDINTIDIEHFKTIIDSCFNKNIKEIYLLSPTLNRNKKRFRHYLEIIINISRKYAKKIKFFGELRPELIDETDMALLKEAGFNQIEVGIQTLDTTLGDKLGRRYNNFNLVDFVNRLKRNGIKPLLDFIIGLPGETKERICETVNYLEENKLMQYTTFFPLLVLPGTEIRKTFLDKNYLFQRNPPYFVLENDTVDFHAIQEIYYSMEEERYFSEWEDFFKPNFNNFTVIKDKADFNLLGNNPYYQTYSLIFADNFSPDEIKSLYRTYFSLHEEVFHSAYLYFSGNINFELINELNIIFLEKKSFYDKYRATINYDGEKSFGKTITLLFPPSIPESYFFTVSDSYAAGILILPEVEKSIISCEPFLNKIYTDYHSYIYTFNKKYKNKFLRLFPKYY